MRGVYRGVKELPGVGPLGPLGWGLGAGFEEVDALDQ